MIVAEVALEVAAQHALVPHDDVVEALAPEGRPLIRALDEGLRDGRLAGDWPGVSPQVYVVWIWRLAGELRERSAGNGRRPA